MDTSHADVRLAPSPAAVDAALLQPVAAGATPPQSLSTPSSPIKGSSSSSSTLLQRQVSRALEMIELYDSAAAAALRAAAPSDAADVHHTTLAAPSATATAAAHVACRAFKAHGKKCPKAVFQISPNAVKRKRSHSMSSISSADHASVDSFRATIDLADKLNGHDHRTSSSSSSHAVVAVVASTAAAVAVPAAPASAPLASSALHKRSNKKLRDARVTPSKRCTNGTNSKKDKAARSSRDKSDVIERALLHLRTEQLDAAANAAHSFEFPSICHSSSTTNASSDTRSASLLDSDCSSDAASRLRVSVGVAAAQGARAYMEDRFTVVARLFDDDSCDRACAPSLLAVFDGHNGALAAEFATTRFRELLQADAFLRDVSQRTANEKLRDDDVAQIQRLLIDAFAVVDDEVLEFTMAQNKRDGSTVLLGLLVGGKLFVANLGDSRGVWCKARDDVLRVSIDHKPDLEDETQRVEDAGGKVIFSGCWRVAHDEIPLRLAISRSLGDHPLKTNLPLSCSAPLVSVTPDIQVVDVGGPDEFLVFATDGLWDRLSDDDAAAIVRAKVDAFMLANDNHRAMKDALRFAASALVEAALEKRSMDNVTAMVISWSTSDSDAFSAVEVADESDGNDTSENDHDTDDMESDA